MIIKNKYFGISYIGWNWLNDFIYKFWERFLCPKGFHLLDESLSYDGEWEHSLICDACNLMIYIDHIDTKYVKAELRTKCQ